MYIQHEKERPINESLRYSSEQEIVDESAQDVPQSYVNYFQKTKNGGKEK